MEKALQSREDLVEAIEYIARETSKLSKDVIGRTFPINSLTIFAHSQHEYEMLIGLQEDMGTPYNENNGPRIKLFKPVIVENNQITYLRIRKPDAERPQVGCNDFETDYKTFKNDYLSKYPNNLRLVKRPEYEMIELHDPSYKVLAYVVSG